MVYYRTFEAGVDYVYFGQHIGLSYKLIEKNSFDLFFGVNYQLEELIQHSEWSHETSNYYGAYANEKPDFLTSQTREKFNAVYPSTLMNTIVVRVSPRKKIGRLFIQADFQLGYVTSQRIFHESYYVVYFNKKQKNSNSTLVRSSIGFSLGYYFGSEIELFL